MRRIRRIAKAKEELKRRKEAELFDKIRIKEEEASRKNILEAKAKKKKVKPKKKPIKKKVPQVKEPVDKSVDTQVDNPVDKPVRKRRSKEEILEAKKKRALRKAKRTPQEQAKINERMLKMRNARKKK